MGRKTWVQDPVTGKLIEKSKYRRSDGREHYIQGDVEAFVSPIDGSVIDDRGKLRRHMAEHGVTDSRDYPPEFIQKRRHSILREQQREGKRERIESLRRVMEKQ